MGRETLMTKKRIETLADAIVAYSGYNEPGSDLYLARNPGGLKAIGIIQARDEKGNRTFRSVIDGYQALYYDLELKVTGKSRAKLKPEDTLVDLAGSYNLPATVAVVWSKWLKKAAKDDTISSRTPLSYFLKD
jgi:hypothetical protein